MKLHSLRELFMAVQGLQKCEPAGHGRVWSQWRHTGVDEAVREKRTDPMLSDTAGAEVNGTSVEAEQAKDWRVIR